MAEGEALGSSTYSDSRLSSLFLVALPLATSRAIRETTPWRAGHLGSLGLGGANRGGARVRRTPEAENHAENVRSASAFAVSGHDARLSVNLSTVCART